MYPCMPLSEVRTSAAFWEAYASDASDVARQRLRLGGARLALTLNNLYEQSCSLDDGDCDDGSDAHTPKLTLAPRVSLAAVAVS